MCTVMGVSLLYKADLEATVAHSDLVSRHHRLDLPQAERLGARLRVAREARGLTQEQVANAAGLNRNHYQLLEQGRAATPSVQRRNGELRPSNPTLATLIELSGVLDVPVSYIVIDVFGPTADLIVEYLEDK